MSDLIVESVNHMLKKSEAKQLVYKMTVKSLRNNKASKLFPDITKDGDLKKLDAAMVELAEFLEKKGKLNDQADAGGQSGPEEA